MKKEKLKIRVQQTNIYTKKNMKKVQKTSVIVRDHEFEN